MRLRLAHAGFFAALTSLSLFVGCGDEGTPDPGIGPETGDGDGDFSLGGQFTGDGDGDTGDGDGDGDDECKGEGVEATPIPVNVLLVVDTSKSMDSTPDGFDDSKWVTLVDSLNTALPDVQDSISMGLKFFPSGDTTEDVCSVQSGVEVDIAPGTEALSKVTEALDAQSPGGDTPTAAALADALSYFEGHDDLEGENIVILATDGGPNCNAEPAVDCTCDGDPFSDAECGEPERCTINIDGNQCDLDMGSCCALPRLCLDDAGTLSGVTDLAEAGVKTIVLGMPGSEAYKDVLDALAEAGGFAQSAGDTKYFKVDDSAGLTKTISSITKGVIKDCEVQLEKEPPAGMINVYVDGELIPKDDEDGWLLNEETDPPTVEITGSVCDRVKDEGVEKISVEFGCDTVIR